MPSLSRAELATYAVCAVLVLVLGWRALRAEPGGGGRPVAERPAVAVGDERGRAGGGAAAKALVHVVGAVREPGVYRLDAGARVEDAIEQAGGATARADLQGVNLAAKVADAQQVVVPRRAPVPAAGGGAPVAGAGPATAAPAGPISLSTATLEQLDHLDGVGPATAQKILDHRAQHGGFASLDDLAAIPGIGPKKLASLKAQLAP